ncbi:MAG: SIMPL domain-containing protein [Anaerolineales bacterium]|jgi:uncharacterized protein YggE
MRTKLFLFAPTLILAILLSACGTATAQVRTMSVSGNGMVSLSPDVAYIYIGVHTDDADLANAVSKNNIQAQALVDALKNAGIDGKDIQTSNFSVYTNNNNGVDKTSGQVVANGNYSVDNTVYVTMRDLSKIGKILNTAVSSGANSINSISFDVADKTTAMAQARQKAMANASSLATELAKMAGVKLGEIQNVTYSDNSSYPYYGMGGGGASAPNASVPIQPGQTQISVSVSVTYIIK